MSYDAVGADDAQPSDTPLDVAARAAAASHALAHRKVRERKIEPQLVHLRARLDAVFAALPVETTALSSRTQWLLDNDYLVLRTLRQIETDMSQAFYTTLPKLADGTPRAQALADTLLRFDGGRLDLAQTHRFVEAYQSIAPLRLGELWALPTFLRIATLERLIEAAPDAEEAGRVEVESDERVADSIVSLHALDTQDWTAFVEALSLIEGHLRDDPAGVYARMDEETRDRYRRAIERVALHCPLEEAEVAAKAVRLARTGAADPDGREELGHVGAYLVGTGVRELERAVGARPRLRQRLERGLQAGAAPLYATATAVAAAVPVALAAAVAVRFGAGLAALALVATLAVPAWVAAEAALRTLVTRLLPPRQLPKLDVSEGVPDEARTLVAIPALFSTEDDIASLFARLERHYLGHRDPNVAFAILGDVPDAPEAVMPDDAVLLERADAELAALRARHPAGTFFLLTRTRRFSRTEGRWMGWERKRGKLSELNRLILRGEPGTFMAGAEDPGSFAGFRFVLTLDADTVLPPGSGFRLIGALAHPLNRPAFDADGRLRQGFTVLQPRIEAHPDSAERTRFGRLFARGRSVDLYANAVSEPYMDLFGEGIYAGKGIYDVEAFERSQAGLVPEGAILSHDLFEGGLGRAGMVSDVVMLESQPQHVLAHAGRQHRWIRGDWQLLPWLAPRVPSEDGLVANPLSWVSRWVLAQNLLRSLAPASLLALFVVGWWLLPGAALAWTAFALVVAAAPVAGLPSNLIRRAFSRRSAYGWNAQSIDGVRWLVELVFLPYTASVAVSAVVATLWRLGVSRRHLLRWTEASRDAQAIAQKRDALSRWRAMASAPTLAVAITALLAAARPGALPAALPLLVAWFLSPQLAYELDRPLRRADRPLTAGQRRWLTSIARRTWLYFERFVGPEDHWLPPDHIQETPRDTVAHRTSPTNIGLLLTSTVAAHDAGFLSTRDLLRRLRNTFETLDSLERHRGHFLNWYDTRTLRPLNPRYVSTVDSGNLLGCLVVVAQGCREALDEATLRWSRFEGLVAVLDLLRDGAQSLGGEGELANSIASMEAHIEAAEARPERWSPLIDELIDHDLPTLEAALLARVRDAAGGVDHETLADLGIWLGRLHRQLDAMRSGRDALLPWLAPDSHVGAVVEVMQELPMHLTFRDLPAAYERLRDALAAAGPGDGADAVRRTNLRSALATAEEVVAGLEEDAADIARRAESYLQDTHLDFLFDGERRLFHIGYHVDEDVLDRHSYDLLASEARIGSFMAIALGRVPPSHWLHLGRPTALVDGTPVLLSWSGTMFEYLMPPLLMRTPAASLLGHACRSAVERQIAFGEAHGVPWGVSESGYARTDVQKNYQYRAFGVPDLALTHEATGHPVVAPYATLMALPWAPEPAIRNLERLVDAGGLGRYGFYEALDYSPAHLAPGERFTVVRSFMAHHHGMSFLGLAHVLHGGRFVRRFHADQRVKAAEILLHEGIGAGSPLERVEPEARIEALRPRFQAPPVEPWEVPARTRSPELHALSNGRYTVFLTNSGAGGSRWDGLDLTRWRSDPTRDAWGQWTYIQDLDRERTWSATAQPMDAPGQDARVQFHPHQVTFHRRDGELSTRLEVVVPPRDDGEIRRVTLINHGDEIRRLAVTSYSEVALAPHGDDVRHPAFAKMFVESRWNESVEGVLFRRRPRSAEDEPAFLLHRLIREDSGSTPPEIETDRRAFLGRHGHAGHPAALRADAFHGTVGATLDPIFALRTRVTIEPHATVQLSFLTLAGRSEHALLATARRYGERDRIEAAFLDARARQARASAQVGLDGDQLATVDRLLSRLLYPDPVARADPARLRSNRMGPNGLWTHGISGDVPILLVRIASERDVELVRTLLAAHRLWSGQGFDVDLVLLNELDAGYVRTTAGALRRLIAATGDEIRQNVPGGVFVLSADGLDEAGRTLLATAARVVMGGEDARSPMPPPAPPAEGLPAHVPAGRREPDPVVPPLKRPANLRYDNGWGGFDEGGAYVAWLHEHATPAPWINVLANPSFGCLITEAGSSTTWSRNSGENRLSPWANDPVSDPSGEVVYLRDEETAELWTPTPQPMPDAAPYRVRHGFGNTTFEHRSHGLDQLMRVHVLDDAPVKVVRLRLTNLLDRPRRVTATYYLEWVLGATREASAPFVIPEYDAELGALLAINPHREAFAEEVAFLAADRHPHGLTTDRREFLGRNGSTRRPTALGRIGLSGLVEAGHDPCAALQLHVDLPPGGTDEIAFLVGAGGDRDEARALIARHRHPQRLADDQQRVDDAWSERLGGIRVRTPDPTMDLMMNGWLMYQSLACRMWGRSALYQSSGAYGFRDQLQDSMGLLHVDPAAARAQLLEAARHQFEEGDVLHWWHPPEGRGVRTRISDDLVWLPFVTAHYIDHTGEAAVLDERVPFLRAPPLAAGEHERFDLFPSTDQAFPLYDHACRALDKAATHGRHGLPLMGGGDWNDGMNRVGDGGRGESVWLAWFLIAALRRFAPLCEVRGDVARARRYRELAEAYRAAVEAHAWDGDWYLRAFYDDGTPLGGRAGDEARIDAIAQAWSVLSGAGDPDRASRALDSARDRLVKREDRLLLLLAPPFDRGEHDPGYIKGYPPGVRENGGQYTHAALWVAWAFASSGRGDEAHALFDLLNPIRHADSAASAESYRVEPYVVAADVYGVEPYVGRGGWTWYTGSAAWMYRLGLEAILGLRRQGAHLVMEPCIPSDWPGFEIDYRHGASTYRIRVRNPHGACRGVASTVVDGSEATGNRFPLVDDGEVHDVVVTMGAAE